MTLSAWMLHALFAGLLVGAAAWLLARALEAGGLPTRGVWLGALLLSVALPWLAPVLAGPADTGFPTAGTQAGAAPPAGTALPGDLETAGEAVPSAVAGPLHLLAGAGAAARGIIDRAALPRAADPWLLAAWLLTSLVGAVGWGRAHLRLRRRLRGRPSERVEGTELRYLEGEGPFVVGVRPPVIVLPTWIRELVPEDRAMILRHEIEHARSADALVLTAGLATVVAFPWNPALWWQLRSLRRAVELDCDRRVLRAGTPAAPYGRLLLQVGSRLPAKAPTLLPALASTRSELEDRLEALRPRPRRRAVPRLLTASLLGVPLVVLACESGVGPTPGIEARELEPAPPEAPATAETPTPTFTPYEVAPEVTNPQEVQRALQESYPRALRDAGIGGRTILHLWIDEEGRVAEALVADSSGHPELDAAAQRVARVFRFTPARNQGEPVAVWVMIPIEFASR